MPPPKRAPTNFEQLLGKVEPLPPSSLRPRHVGTGPTPALPTPARARFVVKREGDTVVGYARDCEESVALRLSPPSDGDSPRTLDLHRTTLVQALERLEIAVRQARSDGLPLLLVVVGKGKHSAASGPVLPGAVIERLAGPLASSVLSFRSAPPRLGGSGALLVRLRPKSQAKS